jgi:hypothetical protein
MRVRRYLAPALRLTALAAAMGVVVSFVCHRRAEAALRERLAALGGRMAPFLDDAASTEAPRELHVNGVTLWLATGASARPPAEVRAWYAARYAGKGSAMERLGGLSAAVFGDDEQGGMAALDLGLVDGGAAWAARLAAVARGQIGEVGALRYLYYERTPSGGTRFLTMWSDDRFDLTRLAPDGDGDVPGRDVAGVPRYPGSARALFSDERGRDGQLVVYTGVDSAFAAAAFYRARLPRLGWRLDERFAAVAAREQRQAQRWLLPSGREVVIDCAAVADGHGATITIVQLHD